MVNGTNGKKKQQTSVCFLQMENSRWKFVFFGRQTINGNRRLLFRQICPSMPPSPPIAGQSGTNL